MSLKTTFLRWLMDNPPTIAKTRNSVVEMVSQDYDDLGTKDASVNFRVMKAMNGRVIEISTFVASPHGGRDRKVDLYLVPEDQKLTEAITHVLAMKALEK